MAALIRQRVQAETRLTCSGWREDAGHGQAGAGGWRSMQRCLRRCAALVASGPVVTAPCFPFCFSGHCPQPHARQDLQRQKQAQRWGGPGLHTERGPGWTVMQGAAGSGQQGAGLTAACTSSWSGSVLLRSFLTTAGSPATLYDTRQASCCFEPGRCARTHPLRQTAPQPRPSAPAPTPPHPTPTPPPPPTTTTHTHTTQASSCWSPAVRR